MERCPGCNTMEGERHKSGCAYANVATKVPRKCTGCGVWEGEIHLEGCAYVNAMINATKQTPEERPRGGGLKSDFEGQQVKGKYEPQKYGHGILMDQKENSCALRGHDLISKRMSRYGDPVDNFTKMSAMWSVILNTTVSPAQVVQCLIAMKQVRELHSHHIDNLDDIAGYTCILERINKAK